MIFCSAIYDRAPAKIEGGFETRRGGGDGGGDVRLHANCFLVSIDSYIINRENSRSLIRVCVCVGSAPRLAACGMSKQFILW